VIGYKDNQCPSLLSFRVKHSLLNPRWLTGVGLSVGRLEGRREGRSVGPGVGEDDGPKEGRALGWRVGACVGTPEGACCTDQDRGDEEQSSRERSRTVLSWTDR
jgi:hypothetical protein